MLSNIESKIIVLYNQIKAIVVNNKVIGGIVIGYVGSPVIKLICVAACDIVKETIKLI